MMFREAVGGFQSLQVLGRTHALTQQKCAVPSLVSLPLGLHHVIGNGFYSVETVCLPNNGRATRAYERAVSWGPFLPTCLGPSGFPHRVIPPVGLPSCLPCTLVTPLASCSQLPAQRVARGETLLFSYGRELQWHTLSWSLPYQTCRPTLGDQQTV